MVGKGGFGRFEHAPHAGEGKIVTRLLRVIAQREIRDRKLHLFGQFQQKAGGDAVFRPDICVHKRVGLNTVDVAQEETKDLFGIGAVFLYNKGLKQPVEITEIDREAGDGRDMAVEDLQYIHRFKQVFRRLELQEFAALLKQQIIVGADVAGTVGHNALIQVAERTFPFGFIVGVGIAQRVIGALTQTGQSKQFLVICQCRVLNDVQGFGHVDPPLSVSVFPIYSV